MYMFGFGLWYSLELRVGTVAEVILEFDARD